MLTFLKQDSTYNTTVGNNTQYNTSLTLNEYRWTFINIKNTQVLWEKKISLHNNIVISLQTNLVIKLFCL